MCAARYNYHAIPWTANSRYSQSRDSVAAVGIFDVSVGEIYAGIPSFARSVGLWTWVDMCASSEEETMGVD